MSTIPQAFACEILLLKHILTVITAIITWIFSWI